MGADIPVRDFERRVRNVSAIDARMRKSASGKDGEAAGARAQIEH